MHQDMLDLCKMTKMKTGVVRNSCGKKMGGLECRNPFRYSFNNFLGGWRNTTGIKPFHIVCDSSRLTPCPTRRAF